jgi:hypothetical protein
MADKDFEIKVRTTADTSGIKETEAGLDRITRRQAEAAAKWAASPLNPANRPVTAGGGIAALGGAAPAPAAAARVSEAGLFGGLAAGLTAGAVTAAFTAVISGVQKLNEELDKQADMAIKTMERVRELQEAFRESTEWAEKFGRIRRLPLTDEIKSLEYELIRLKTEQSLVNQSTEDGVRSAIKYQQQIDSVTAALEGAKKKEKDLKDEQAKRHAAERERAFVEEPKFLTRAFVSATPQARAILEQEAAARKAQAEGDSRSADLFRKSEEAFKRGATPEQRAEAEQLAPHLTEILNELKKQTLQWQ